MMLPPAVLRQDIPYKSLKMHKTKEFNSIPIYLKKRYNYPIMKARGNTMDPVAFRRHQFSWNVFQTFLTGWIHRKFDITTDDFDAEGPIIIIPNHSCAWDPLLVGYGLGRKYPAYYVASEHILRWRVYGPLLKRYCAPIPRKKASMGTETVMAILRHVRAGHNVCLFAEGEQTWDGLTQPVFPATGKLVRQSGATLVTYRLDGAYLSLPRWAKGVRKGKVHGHAVGVYPPEQLKAMKPQEITDIINRDLAFDVWQWQKEQPTGPIHFIPGKKVAEAAKGLERALFICPSCKKVGTLEAKGDTFACRDCGYGVRYLDTGFFEDLETAETADAPSFPTIAEWDAWEKEELAKQFDAAEADSMNQEDPIVFFDDPATLLSRIEDGHEDTPITEGPLSLSIEDGEAVLTLGEERFRYSDINFMAPILTSLMLFSTGDGYYQITAGEANVRKYILAWQYFTEKKKAEKSRDKE